MITDQSGPAHQSGLKRRGYIKYCCCAISSIFAGCASGEGADGDQESPEVKSTPTLGGQGKFVVDPVEETNGRVEVIGGPVPSIKYQGDPRRTEFLIHSTGFDDAPYSENAVIGWKEKSEIDVSIEGGGGFVMDASDTVPNACIMPIFQDSGDKIRLEFYIDETFRQELGRVNIGINGASENELIPHDVDDVVAPGIYRTSIVTEDFQKTGAPNLTAVIGEFAEIDPEADYGEIRSVIVSG